LIIFGVRYLLEACQSPCGAVISLVKC